MTSLQILLSYTPFFSTRYVKVQLFRLKVGVCACSEPPLWVSFPGSGLGLSELRSGGELLKIIIQLLMKVV